MRILTNETPFANSETMNLRIREGMKVQFTIKQARQYAGLTQAQMAESLGVCRHRYMKIEKDIRSATVEELQKVAVATGIPMRDLVFLSDITNVDS